MRRFLGKREPVEGVATDPRYLDVWVPPGKRKTLAVELERHAFAYVFEGSGSFRSTSKPFGVLTEKEVDGNEALVRESTGNRKRPAALRPGVAVRAADIVRLVREAGGALRRRHGVLVLGSGARCRAFTGNCGLRALG